MSNFLKALTVFLFCVSIYPVKATTPALQDLPLLSTLTKDSITWTFKQAVHVGQFVTGDYYVVGACTITAIIPAPVDSPARNGSVLNVPLNQGVSGFDDRTSGGRFQANLHSNPPISLKPGDALISSISIDTVGLRKRWLREGNELLVSPVKTVSILTCVAAPVPLDAFRPSYGDRTQKIYCADSLRRSLLPQLTKAAGAPDIKTWAWHFRRPWLDICFFGFDAAIAYQPDYGREVGRATGIAALLLECNFTAAEKESLLIGFVQYGVDLWGIARSGFSGWQAHGGHGNGRKMPIVFAGILLGDTAMANPNKSMPNLRFGEDMQTAYGPCWCSPLNVVYAGHQGLWNGQPVNSDPAWGPYEHLQPSQWADNMNENYRRCCTSICWIGQALAIWLLQAQTQWNHPAFFDYCDRWMTEKDSQAVAIILQQRGWDYTNSFRQGQTMDPFVNNMWALYRSSVTGISPSTPKKNTNDQTLTITLAPNPFAERITITIDRRSLRASTELAIYNSTGDKVYAQPVTGLINADVSWDAKDLSGKKVEPGIYYVRCGNNIRHAVLLK